MMLFLVFLMFTLLILCMKYQIQIFFMSFFLFLAYNIMYMMIIKNTSTMFFGLSLLVIFVTIMKFSNDYFNDWNWEFYFVFFSFLGSMLGLIYIYGAPLFLMFWDLLGLTSLFLILFYKTPDALKASFITFLVNRFGDFFLMFFLGIFMYNLLVMMKLNFFITLAAWTKSAMYPFSIWLIWAMMAPTPVSALVHSSTLVTAGITILLFQSHLFNNLFIMLISFGMLTGLMLGLMCINEQDMKKFMAYSTISQMGLLYSFSVISPILMSLMYLIVHGVIKSLLFIMVGYLIISANTQSLKKVVQFVNKNWLMTMNLNWSLFMLFGFFSFAMLAVKHTILNTGLLEMKFIIMLLVFYTMLSITFIYSVYMSLSLSSKGKGIFYYNSKSYQIILMIGYFLIGIMMVLVSFTNSMFLMWVHFEFSFLSSLILQNVIWIMIYIMMSSVLFFIWTTYISTLMAKKYYIFYNMFFLYFFLIWNKTNNLITILESKYAYFMKINYSNFMLKKNSIFIGPSKLKMSFIPSLILLVIYFFL